MNSTREGSKMAPSPGSGTPRGFRPIVKPGAAAAFYQSSPTQKSTRPNRVGAKSAARRERLRPGNVAGLRYVSVRSTAARSSSRLTRRRRFGAAFGRVLSSSEPYAASARDRKRRRESRAGLKHQLLRPGLRRSGRPCFLFWRAWHRPWRFVSASCRPGLLLRLLVVGRLRLSSLSDLKSVSYQPPPLRRNTGADTSFFSCRFLQLGHLLQRLIGNLLQGLDVELAVAAFVFVKRHGCSRASYRAAASAVMAANAGSSCCDADQDQPSVRTPARRP